MIRSLLTLVLLAGLAAFGYFYFSGGSGGSQSDRLADAARQTGDAAMDQGLSMLVKTRLTTAVGFSLARFLHVWSDNGKVLVYGLLPEGVSPELVRSAVRGLPGVTEVDVRIATRPTYLDGPSAAPAAAAPAPQPGPR